MLAYSPNSKLIETRRLLWQTAAMFASPRSQHGRQFGFARTNQPTPSRATLVLRWVTGCTVLVCNQPLRPTESKSASYPRRDWKRVSVKGTALFGWEVNQRDLTSHWPCVKDSMVHPIPLWAKWPLWGNDHDHSAYTHNVTSGIPNILGHAQHTKRSETNFTSHVGCSFSLSLHAKKLFSFIFLLSRLCY